MPHPAAAYWNTGVRNVPRQTGAAALLDARDVAEVAQALGVPLPFGRVLDVGCGTGRAAVHCTDYVGVDIAEDAVAYCRARRIKADEIDGPASLTLEAFEDTFDLVLALSVFTHIDQAERAAYLEAFAALAPRAIVDIIPGDGRGNVALWTCQIEAFAVAAHQAGWAIRHVHDRPSPEGVAHRYYLLE